MKRILLASMLCFSTCIYSILAQDSQPSEYLVLGDGLHMSVGSSIALTDNSLQTVTAKEETFESPFLGKGYVKRIYPDLEIVYKANTNKIYMITYVGKIFSTSKGIRVGDKVNILVAKYGKGKSAKTAEGYLSLSYLYYYGDEENVAIEFTIKDDRIRQIAIFRGYN